MQNSVANETVLFKTVDIKVGPKNLSVKIADELSLVINLGSEYSKFNKCSCC
jgi:hypothetical protein